MTILLSQAVRVGGTVLAAGTTQTLAADIEADLVHRKMATYTSDPAIALNDVPVKANINPLTGGIEVSKVVCGRSAAELAAAPTAKDIAFGDSTVFYDIADPTKRYAMKSDHTAFTAIAGGSATIDEIGFRSAPTIWFAGDSIAGMWATDRGESPLWWAKTELYPCEFTIIGNTAVGGTSSSHLISNQIATLEAAPAKPDVVIIQTLQNDSIASFTDADTFTANVTQYATRALAAGVPLVVICSRPPKEIGGANVPASVAYANRKLEIFCRDTNGAFYCDVFGVWRRFSTADENNGASSKVTWKGTANTDNSYSDDGTHPTFLAARAAAPLIEPVLRRVARPVTPMPSALIDFNPTTAPYNNALGRNGMMVGTGGQYNGVDNANVPGASATGTGRWFVTDGNGITATPSIVTGADGYAYLELTLSGTASALATIQARYSYSYDVPLADYIAECMVEIEALTGVKEVMFNTFNGVQLSTNANANNNCILPANLTTKLHLRSKRQSYQNTGSATRNNDFRIIVKSGSTVSGKVRFGRCGIYRVS